MFPISAANETLDCGLPIGECDILRVIKKVTLSADIILVAITAFCIIVLKKYKFFNERILCYMLLNNFLSAVIGFGHDAPPGSESSGLCIAQGYFSQVTSMCKFTWVCVLTVYLYHRLVKDKDTIRYEWLYIMVSCGVPILLAIIPLITKDYGHAGTPYCWIRRSSSGIILRILIYWAPVFGGLFIVMVTFIYMYWHAHKAIQLFGTQDPNTHKHRMLVKKYLKPLMAYAISIAALNAPQFIKRVDNVIHTPVFGLVLVHILCHYSYGPQTEQLSITRQTCLQPINLVIGYCADHTVFVTNGKKSFTRDKFIEGFYYYRSKLVCRRSESDQIELVEANMEVIHHPE